MVGYKTLRKIDGKDYIELAEHEEILKGFVDFKQALEDVKSTISGLANSTKEIGGSLKELMGS